MQSRARHRLILSYKTNENDPSSFKGLRDRTEKNAKQLGFRVEDHGLYISFPRDEKNSSDCWLVHCTPANPLRRPARELSEEIAQNQSIRRSLRKLMRFNQVHGFSVGTHNYLVAVKAKEGEKKLATGVLEKICRAGLSVNAVTRAFIPIPNPRKMASRMVVILSGNREKLQDKKLAEKLEVTPHAAFLEELTPHTMPHESN